MIVRISGEGQYSLSDALGNRLNELDNQVVEAVEQGDENRFKELFGQMIEFVRSQGEQLPADDLSSSEIILPPTDTDFAEAKADFTGEGLIPG